MSAGKGYEIRLSGTGGQGLGHKVTNPPHVAV